MHALETSSTVRSSQEQTSERDCTEHRTDKVVSSLRVAGWDEIEKLHHAPFSVFFFPSMNYRLIEKLTKENSVYLC